MSGWRVMSAPSLSRQRVQELGQLRLQRAADGRHAERRERHQVGVELADPVDQAVAAGVADQHVAAGAAVRAVLVARVRVGHVVEAAVGGEVVVGVQQVVAVAAVEVVAAGAADEPVVAEVAEDARRCRRCCDATFGSVQVPVGSTCTAAEDDRALGR